MENGIGMKKKRDTIVELCWYRRWVRDVAKFGSEGDNREDMWVNMYR